jgi:hypothetical protein
MSLSIAVVTKRAGITLTLRSKIHDLVEVRPTEAWLARAWPEDVVVLDLDAPAAAVAAIEELRSTDKNRPIVVISGEGDQWEELGRLFTDLLIVPLPITAATLLDTVDRAAALATDWVPSLVPVVATDEDGGLSTIEPPISVMAAPRLESQATTTKPTKHKASPRRSQTAVPQAHPDDPAGQELASSRVVHFVELLLRDVNLLPRLGQTAEVVRRDATAAVPAEASVVLVPDGEIWRVEAGHNLRPLEQRFQIDSTHWLAAEIARLRRGLVIKNTDIARNQLAGAPLASWANWLALPVGDTEVIVVLAREGIPFAKTDMTRATQAIAHMAAEVRHAIAVRALARAMSDFRDLVD